MKEEVFYGQGIGKIKNDYPEIHDALIKLNEAVFTGKSLDYKTQKLIAIGITAANSDTRAIKKQMKSAMNELDITKEEIMDVLRVVLLTAGNPPFMKAISILEDLD